MAIQLEGKMVFPIYCTMQMAGQLHNCKHEQLYFGHISQPVTKVLMQSR